MKKKNLLFVMPSLSAGGGEKSLVNLLSHLNYEEYNVDLFLFSKNGVFLNLLPIEVNLLESKKNHIVFSNSLKNSVTNFLKMGQYKLAYSRLMFTLLNRVIKSPAISEQYTWKYQSKSIDMLDKEYDIAIGYLEKSSIYFVVDKVKSKKKIGWVHTNYTNSGMDYKFDNFYFNKLDHIITVSQECANALKITFPHIKNKVRVIYNIVSPNIIESLSNEEIQDNHLFNKNCTNIVTVARLSNEKGLDLAIRSCKLLIEKGYHIKWYVLGDGNEREKLASLINNIGVKNHFILLGIKSNPYPYIKKSDIYVQPSRYEGKSIAIDEAKILGKPIILTNFKTAKDQIYNGINGLIVGLSEEEITLGIEELIQNENCKNNLVTNLRKEKLGTEEEINKLYEIF
ncbi:glycosyl transferase family 1 [Bacillus sp. SA1-12]|uniref:glycosyltransferase n=1 Tax=Bacillus sp. SA1-12 TaxID=1455638 RepID=UPI000626E026|nr:glycosyltransferase [Bacillus sp. SA1-12]KKI91435.1 glycosyl transferase family 1 [Bacillus sp. SA1-12]